MKLHHYCLLSMLALATWGPVSADSNFASNPKLPFPPSCLYDMDALEERGMYVAGYSIELLDSKLNSRIPFTWSVSRIPCSETGRSLILFELVLAGAYLDQDLVVELPSVSAQPKGKNYYYNMTLVADPNSRDAWGPLERHNTYLVNRPGAIEDSFGDTLPHRRWRFLLVSQPSLYYFDPSEAEWWGMPATEYNGPLHLFFGQSYQLIFERLEFELPSTSTLFGESSPPLPLSGRHSGTWVIEGAKDQGFQLSISEQVGQRTDGQPGIPERPLVAFLSQYTFDADSRPLWLVGNAEFQPGATEVTIPVYRVTDGRFRSDRPAQREFAGQVTLRSNSCNDVGFSYDYGNIGLGAGSRRLERLFSLETAGYECREYEARVAANR